MNDGGSFPRTVQIVRLTADGQAYLHPCLLWFAHLVSTGASSEDTYLYDGFGTSGRLVMTLSAPSDGAEDFSPARPLPFTAGLYVDIGTNVKEVVLGFVPLPEA